MYGYSGFVLCIVTFLVGFELCAREIVVPLRIAAFSESAIQMDFQFLETWSGNSQANLKDAELETLSSDHRLDYNNLSNGFARLIVYSPTNAIFKEILEISLVFDLDDDRRYFEPLFDVDSDASFSANLEGSIELESIDILNFIAQTNGIADYAYFYALEAATLEDDEEGDGLTLAHEYIIGGNPYKDRDLQSDSLINFEISEVLGEPGFKLSYIKSSFVEDVEVRYWYTEDLNEPWKQLTGRYLRLSPAPISLPNGMEKVERVYEAFGDNVFFRIEFVVPDLPQ